jgi:hypothetical protein
MTGIVSERKSLEYRSALVSGKCSKRGRVVGSEITCELRFITFACSRESGYKRCGWIGVLSEGASRQEQHDGREE